MQSERARETRPEFVILTGALGSGKTTLLSEFLSCADTADTGVLVNDAGEVNVDGAIIEADHRNLAVATLDGGCVCCSVGNDLQAGIDALLLARAERGLAPPRRIILETSGLAEPAPIVRSLRAIRQVEFDVRIVATFDAFQPHVGDSFLPHYPAQLAAAQKIVLTKLDKLPKPSWKTAVERALLFNPIASHVATDRPNERALVAFAPDKDRSFPRASQFSADTVSPTRISVAFAEWERSASWDAISEWIENLTGFLGSRLLRLKGHVWPQGYSGPLLLNGVGDAFSTPRSMSGINDLRLGLMLILRDVTVEELRQSFGSDVHPRLRFQ